MNRPSLTLAKFDIRLTRVVPRDLELIRRKRNDANGKNIYVDETWISKDRQKKWYESINRPDHYYFIVWQGRKKVGMIHNKNMSEDLSAGEGGIIIWDEQYALTSVGSLASMILYEFFFEVIGQKICYGKTLLSNKTRVRANELYGYEKIAEVVNGNYILQQLTREKYLSYSKPRWVKYLNIIKQKPLKIEGYISATQHPAINKLL